MLYFYYRSQFKDDFHWVKSQRDKEAQKHAQTRIFVDKV